MALELALSDPYGNDYPAGYRRFVFLAVNAQEKTIRVVFNNYKDADARNSGKDQVSQTEYRIASVAVPPVLAADGKTEVTPAIPSYDEFAIADAANPGGIGALVYGFAKSRPENKDAKDV